MAMLHPSDSTFAQTDPLSPSLISSLFERSLGVSLVNIESPKSSQGLYHKVYFVSLAESAHSRWSGKDVVLRVARKAIERIKIENEVAVIDVVRNAGLPVPEVLFYNNDPANDLGFEYICVEKLPYPSLQDTWTTLSQEALDNVLNQFVNFFIRMFTLELPQGGKFYGSLRVIEMEGRREAVPGPVLEETLWQLPDILRYFHAAPYNLTRESFVTLNPCGWYPSWVAYISAFLKCYYRVILIHPSVSFLLYLLDPLQRLIQKLDSREIDWVRRLRDEKGLQGRLWHRDLHFGYLLSDEEGNIHAIIDWEFSGVGPSFHKTSSPVRNCISFAYSSEPTPSADKLRLLNEWPEQFLSRLKAASPSVYNQWVWESDPEQVLGREGKALSDVREYLRSCLEVGVRQWGNVEAGKGAWKDVVETRLRELECW
ncbi:kinase-like domain-containing protein [Armillaria luteobubalina]|uniref:Kinase-like domain-containing protein n=1 Tax=Armillaria luteobubalina TaxID=153913 RepID=A0AA39URA8_9AGAR|nr:kinase-like domain-containing protein [Armillaria luteobubalina]